MSNINDTLCLNLNLHTSKNLFKKSVLNQFLHIFISIYSAEDLSCLLYFFSTVQTVHITHGLKWQRQIVLLFNKDTCHRKLDIYWLSSVQHMFSCVAFTAHCADFEWCAKWSHPLHHTMYLFVLSLFIQNNVSITVFCCNGDG